MHEDARPPVKVFARARTGSSLFVLNSSGARQYWETIADDLSKAGWSWGCVSAVDSCGRTVFVADAHHGAGKRYVVPCG